MLKKIKISILVIFLALVTSAIVKNVFFDTPDNCLKKIKSRTSKNDIEADHFKTNRTFIYKMYFWSIIPMGELRYSTQAGATGIVFSFEALTKKSFIENFINAQARVESHFSKKDFLPYKYAEKTVVNGKIKQKDVLYDRDKLLSVQGDKKIKITRDTYDPVGAFVHILTLPLELNKDYSIPFLSGYDMYLLKARLLKKGRRIDEIDIDMRRQNLTSSHGGHFRVWVTADNSKIPLLFKSWTPVGFATVVLESVDNVK